MTKYPSGLLVVTLILSIAACDSGDGGETEDTETETSTSTDTEGEADEFIEDVTVEVHDIVNTILVVSWTQVKSADNVWLRFTFENDEWFESPAKPGETGEHEELVLGIPENTDVTINIVVEQGGEQALSSPHQGTTGAVPASMPRPTVESYDPAIASANRWLMGSVNDTPAAEEAYYGTFWIYIIDRTGRIVWYYSDIADNPVIGFPRISRDNRYIFFGNRRPWEDAQGFVITAVKMTLDWEYFEEFQLNLWDNMDMTDSGSLLYNSRPIWSGGSYQDSYLMEYMPDGTDRYIWNCTAVFDDNCYSNTVNWNPIDDTVLMSFPYLDTVVEIDRESGDMVAQYGDLPGSYGFDPPTWDFGFQHYANITPYGTLMVSSHMPGSDTNHGFLEFDIDRKNQTLVEKWYFDGGDEWAHAMGEAHYVLGDSDNILGNYGTAGVIKEITQDKQVAWQVKFDADWPNDAYNKMVGHCTLFDDLYALVQGPE